MYIYIYIYIFIYTNIQITYIYITSPKCENAIEEDICQKKIT